MKKQERTKVLVWEMDSWSGRKLIETKHFNYKETALKFVEKFNSKNTDEKVPEYYIYAEII